MSAGVAGRPHPAGDPRLPDFIAIGPPRTGTTWLYRALSGDGNPEFATILKVVRALGLKLTPISAAN